MLPHAFHPCPLAPFHKVSLGVKVILGLFFLIQGGSLTQVHDTLGTAETTQEGCAGPRTPPVWGGSGMSPF